MASLTVVPIVLLTCLVSSLGLSYGPRIPISAWSSWNTFRENVSDSLILSIGNALTTSGLKDAGYNQVWIDDGWSVCSQFKPDGSCAVAGPRGSDGCIVPDPQKFPRGMLPLAQDLATLGVTLGIYTGVSSRTCGGFQGSLGNEEIDAKCFVSWGVGAVKLDTCNSDCPVVNGCIQNSTSRFQRALNATGKEIYIYIDSGNPTSPQLVYNPKQYHVSDPEMLLKVATSPQELVWVWSQNTAHMTKSWFDIFDAWESTMGNAHNQAFHVNMYQSCGYWSFPGMLTVGQGAQTEGEYRVQFFLWAILGSPLVLGNDVRSVQASTLQLLTAPEVLAVNRDPDCTQGSLVSNVNASEIWLRPLSGGRFGMVMLNKDPVHEQAVTLAISQDRNWGMFYPAFVKSVSVRDAWAGRELGVFNDTFTQVIQPHDGSLFVLTVLE